MTEIAKNQTQAPATIKSMLGQENVKKRFEEILGNKAPGFISSILNTTNQNKLLQSADPNSIILAAAVAATLDLPINQNLGLAWIVPYKGQAQFQMGWKGFVQLALRTGQYLKLNAQVVKAGQLKKHNPLTEEFEWDWSVEGGEVIGYVAYFKLNNGFEKTAFWNVGKVKAHAKRYSKSVDNGPWKTHFDEMALKTVVKNTLSQYGILSIEMQKALSVDQAAIKDENGTPEYLDSPEFTPHEEVTTEVQGEKLNQVINQIPTGNDL